MICAEVAIYPLKTSGTTATSVINNSIDSIKNGDVDFDVNSMNTRLTGSKQEIFNSLERMFTEAENNGSEVSMVVTITNAV